MAIAIASTSSASDNDVDNVSVTAPTGIETGDLLLIIASYGDRTANITCTGFTESFAINDNAAGTGQDSNITVLYKIAVSADESETSYSVGNTAGWMGAVHMFRITGFGESVDPVFDYNNGTGSISTTGGLTVSKGVSILRPSQGAYFIVAAPRS